VAFGSRRLPLERRNDGTIVVGLGDDEREVLRHLLGQLRVMVQAPETGGSIDGDSPLRRLFPTAYPSDVEREDEYQEMVRSTLVEQRLAALESVDQTLDSDTINDDLAGTWLTTLNDLRLVIGTRLDVSEEDMEIDPDDPDAQLQAVYHYLGFLVDRLVTALAESLPDPSQ
jgi:hypothetical protein